MKPRACALVSLTLLGFVATTLHASAQEAPVVSGTLPLKDVVLFSSGVGYFQRTGQLTGAADIPLSFRTEQVNDILKSLVLFDSAGGVRPVTYTTRDATVRKLRGVGQALD